MIANRIAGRLDDFATQIAGYQDLRNRQLSAAEAAAKQNAYLDFLQRGARAFAEAQGLRLRADNYRRSAIFDGYNAGVNYWNQRRTAQDMMFQANQIAFDGTQQAHSANMDALGQAEDAFRQLSNQAQETQQTVRDSAYQQQPTRPGAVGRPQYDLARQGTQLANQVVDANQSRDLQNANTEFQRLVADGQMQINNIIAAATNGDAQALQRIAGLEHQLQVNLIDDNLQANLEGLTVAAQAMAMEQMASQQKLVNDTNTISSQFANQRAAEELQTNAQLVDIRNQADQTREAQRLSLIQMRQAQKASLQQARQQVAQQQQLQQEVERYPQISPYDANLIAEQRQIVQQPGEAPPPPDYTDYWLQSKYRKSPGYKKGTGMIDAPLSVPGAMILFESVGAMRGKYLRDLQDYNRRWGTNIQPDYSLDAQKETGNPNTGGRILFGGATQRTTMRSMSDIIAEQSQAQQQTDATREQARQEGRMSATGGVLDYNTTRLP